MHNLHSIRRHFSNRIKCDAPVEAVEIVALTYDDIQTMRKHYLESEQAKTTKGLSSVEMKKLSPLKWPQFKSGIIEILGRTIGRNGIPLIYVIREFEINDFEINYDSREEKLIQCMNLNGANYKSDNSSVFSVLLSYTEDTEGHSIIQMHERRRNGRSAWKVLLGHFEGSTYKKRLVQEAANMIRSTSYSGPRNNFTFGKYFDRHSKAHVKLEQANKPMSIEQHIDAFIQGINCATAQSIVVNLAGDPSVRTSFDTYYNAVASRLELSLSLTAKSANRVERHVNETANKRRKTFDKNKGKNRPNKNSSNNFIPEAKSYNSEEWKKMGKTNQDKVKELYRVKKS